MSAPSPSRAPLARHRAKAHLLLTALRGSDPARARAVATRLRRLRSFAHRDAAELLADRTAVRLKHLLTLVAVEAGHASWPALVRAHDAAAPNMWVPQHGVLLNRWFADHDDARASLREQGGYLLPFRDQFFITERAGIEALGLDPDDPDWTAIGFDFVAPDDGAAHARLAAKRDRASRR